MIFSRRQQRSLHQDISIAAGLAILAVSLVLIVSSEIRNTARVQQDRVAMMSLHEGLLQTMLDLQRTELEDLARQIEADRQVIAAFRGEGDKTELERVLDSSRDGLPLAVVLVDEQRQIMAASSDVSALVDESFFQRPLNALARTDLLIGPGGAPALMHHAPVRHGTQVAGMIHILLPIANVVDDYFPGLAGLMFRSFGGALTPLEGASISSSHSNTRDTITIVPIASDKRLEAAFVPIRLGKMPYIGDLIFLRDVTQAIQQEELLSSLTFVAVIVLILISLGLLSRSLRLGFRPLEAVVQLLEAMSEGNRNLRFRRAALVNANANSGRDKAFGVEVPHREIGSLLRAVESFRSGLDAQRSLLVVREQLENAKRIQQSLLPQSFDQHMGLDIFGRMRPALEVAGDFFDIFRLNDDKLAVVIADVSGKGLAPALFASQASALFRAQFAQYHDPAEAIRVANKALCERNPEDMFLTCILAVITPDTQEVSFVNAGHCPPIVIRADGTIHQVETEPEPIVGIIPDLEWSEHKFILKEGESCLLYSDGFDEAQKEDGEMLGTDRVLEMFREASVKNSVVSEKVALSLFNEIDEFSAGAPQADDITIITIRTLKKGRTKRGRAQATAKN
ncbi:MAG: PP2C family protein-serine/threonine phosphatase [Aestuariivita sp.]|nr:PP2C family protein-serine/threonine phosphatase [Aestuariivita sp.]MCY4203586.1 PP2C family protein-serine/threonine phosphatase [Aestuariivita sp.]MCY4288922.1 PP2C family protein-serine/threonine phosphatase [Aestuariivita sp.]MCY4346163.1 PP2C family protein-serine/threonine phosphatase [Aestuariivita sp.]